MDAAAHSSRATRVSPSRSSSSTRSPTRRPPAHDRPREGRRQRSRKRRPLAEGTHIYDALNAAVAQVRGSALAGARSSSCPTATTSAAPRARLRARQLEAQNIRVYTVGIESPDFKSDDLERSRTRPAAPTRADSPEALTQIYDELGFKLGNEYLLRYRSPAQPDQEVDVNVAVDGPEPVSFSYTSPNTGTAAPLQAGASRDQLMQSALVPLLVRSCSALAVFTIRRSGASGRTRHWSHASASSSRSRPKSRPSSAARRSTRSSPRPAQKQRSASFRWLEGFIEDVDVAQITHTPTKMLWLAGIAGSLLGARRSRADRAVLDRPPRRSALGLNMYVRNKARKTRSDSPSSSPRTSTCSRRRSARVTASRARWASSPTRRRSRRSASSRAS